MTFHDLVVEGIFFGLGFCAESISSWGIGRVIITGNGKDGGNGNK
ncbi:hypothetical protein [Paraflavitalea speifideaquila]|nr:hypothetical protein [Paraflavitalea speifideiaquila]